MSYIPPTGPIVNFGDAASSSNNPLLTPEMAGYIDALYALLADSSPGHTNIFQGLLQEGDSNDPSTQALLRMVMGLIGSPNFQSALNAEYAAEEKLPVSEQCSQFMSLYASLTECDGSKGLGIPRTNSDGSTTYYSVMGLAEKYIQDGGPTSNAQTILDQQAIQEALGTGGSLDRFINNIGSNSDGYNNNQLSPYQRPPELSELITDLNNLFKYLNESPPDIKKALTIVRNIEFLGQNNPDLTNDPNYLLVMQFLSETSFNPPNGEILDGNGNPIKDINGNIIYCNSVLDFANLDMSKLSPADQTTVQNYFEKCAENGQLNTGTQNESWAEIFQMMAAYITKY